MHWNECVELGGVYRDGRKLRLVQRHGDGKLFAIGKHVYPVTVASMRRFTRLYLKAMGMFEALGVKG